MSAANQGGNKKSGSSNSSMVNTPASTPVTTMANGQNTTQTSPPPNNNAPKYGTLVPNRIFVGGISANTTESELLQLFSNYGTVKAAKIIQDRAGVSKGYGFITFESEDDAKRLQRESDNIVLRERKLNIAPAIKKQSLQPFSRAFDASSPPAVAPGNPAQYFFQPSAVPYFQGGVAYYPQPPTGPTDPAAQQPTVYQPPSVYPPQSAPPQTAAYPPVMFPAQPIYMPQQYPMPMPYDYNYYSNGGAQFMVGSQGGPQSQVPSAAAAAAAVMQQQQRPNSPPRGAAAAAAASCYSHQPPQPHQIPFANTPEQMYYNMPMYGGPLDGAIMYAADAAAAAASAMDMSMSNGTLPEEFNTQDAPSSSPTNNTHSSNTHYPIEIHQHIAAAQQQGSAVVVLDDGSGRKASEERKSATPVVSLLSLDEHQEKDPLSMQSGRRRKAPVSITMQTTVPNHVPQQQHYSNGFAYNYNYLPTLPSQSYGMNSYYSFGQLNQKQPVNRERAWVCKWRGNERSCISSPRTESNSSSASAVDENRNEDNSSSSKVVINSAMTTPPPAPYSPMTNYTNRSFYANSNTRNTTQNARNCGRGGNSNSQEKAARCYHPAGGNGNARNINNNISANNNSSNKEYSWQRPAVSAPPPVPVYAKPPHSPVSSSSPQMHPGGQHFVPPRRNRRNVRRNGSSGLSEIGAGDAPLPNAPEVSVSEVCNKLDNLKM